MPIPSHQAQVPPPPLRSAPHRLANRLACAGLLTSAEYPYSGNARTKRGSRPNTAWRQAREVMR